MAGPARFRDFDEAFAEQAAEPVRVRLYGRDWELPGRLPAAAPLKIARYMGEGREQTSLTAAELLDLAADLIPRVTLDEWLARGLDIEVQLPGIIEWLLRAYMGDDAVDEAAAAEVVAAGEARAPEPGAEELSSSSSNGGGSSKPTSPASTESTFPRF